mmetsp:Transcript_35216/g.77069  ORF Transcript_35216/g.77069 Transcript_35216/m.77069 type:complete len:240 (-) Transcript_35216:126-845(-)
MVDPSLGLWDRVYRVAAFPATWEDDPLIALPVFAVAAYLARWLLVLVLRTVVRDVVADSRVRGKTCAAFHGMMGRLVETEEFQSTSADVMMSPIVEGRLKAMFLEMLRERHLADNLEHMSERVLKGLSQNHELKQLIIEQMKDSLQDQELHRAAMKGVVDAMPSGPLRVILSRTLDIPKEDVDDGGSEVWEPEDSGGQDQQSKQWGFGQSPFTWSSPWNPALFGSSDAEAAGSSDGDGK